MTTNLTRRTALTAAAVLPLLPIAASATVANTTMPNATDAAWAELKAARAAFDAEMARPDTEDEVGYALSARVCEAERLVIGTPAATLTDLERKVSILAGCEVFDEVRPGVMPSILSDVRCLAGSGAA